MRIPRIRDWQNSQLFCLVYAVINSGLQNLCKSTSPLVYVVQRCCHSSLVLQQTLSSAFMFSILPAHCQQSKCPDSLLVHLGMCGLLSHYQTAPALKLKCHGFRREQCCLQKHLTLLCLDAKLADGRDLLTVKQLQPYHNQMGTLLISPSKYL